MFAEAQWKPIERLKLIVGGRVDVDTRFSDLPFSPRFSGIYSLTKELTAKLIYTQAYVAPPPYFAYAVFDNGSALNTANPNLKPESARSVEANVVYDRKDLSVGLSVYANHQDSLLIVGDTALSVNVVNPMVFVPNGDGTFGTRKLTESTNSGRSDAYGSDLYGRYRVGKVSGWGSYSFVTVKTNIGGVDTGLAGIPAHQFRLGVTYAVLNNLFATTSLKLSSTPQNLIFPTAAAGASPEFVANAPNLQSAAKVPYTLNLHVLYTNVVRGADLFLDVQNLTNHLYAQRGLLEIPVPKEMFSAMVGARVRF